MNSIYKVKSAGYIHRKVADSDILIPVGKNIAHFNGYVELNPAACILWDAMKNGKTEEDLAVELMQQFDISEEMALNDTREFILELIEHEMVDVS